MSGVPEEYSAWAPPGGSWSRWVKPVLFAFMDRVGPYLPDGVTQKEWTFGATESWISKGDGGIALILDLPGVEAVEAGLALVSLQYRPVPLHNACPSVSDVSASASLLDMWPIIRLLRAGADRLAQAGLPDNAPPVFLLDSRRRKGTRLPEPGKFDNRWLAMPQDFPSASYLLSKGIRTVVLVSEDGVEEDLLHVLLPWRKAGIRIQGTGSLLSEPKDLTLRTPWRLGHMAYRFLALLGLRRNSVGGFGSVIPMPTEGRSGFG